MSALDTAVRRIVLVEDEKTIRTVIEILLSTEPDFELVGWAASAEEGIELVRRLEPDLVLLDNQLEGAMTGLQAAPSIKELVPSVVVLLCTALDLEEVATIIPSIDGYLRKDDLVELVDVVRTLLDQPGSA